MSFTYEELTTKHPCFARGKHGNTGRIHLPTSPECNIQCKFCNRIIDDFEKRPGVSSTVITPQECIDIVKKSRELCKEITVAGIAGPGDTLATNSALDTFRLIKKEFPDLIKCMSTNGLLLVEKAQEIIDVGIDSLTVTVNAVDPMILSEINGGITYHGKYYTGIKAAEILIKNQLEGIKIISNAGITIKVNTVLIPEINIDHIEEVAKTVSKAGASIYNIIPLIPQFKLAHCSAPTCKQTNEVRKKAGKYIDVFYHCQRCRADAIGVPGKEDFSEKVYLRRLVQKETFSHG